MSLATGDNPLAGQLSATTSATYLGASTPCLAVLVQNDPGSTPNVSVGDSSNQYVVLQPGQCITIPCANVNQVYVRAASSTATVNFLATR